MAGRAQELKSIRYYLGLTAAGQSPHLALIGQRGVGKTSLLNGAESVARELNLLPVRLDMNEQKANSQLSFWRDLYYTLALAMAKAGCWGGLQGKIYASLLQMIYSGRPGSLDDAVMQIPYVLSCHQGGAESFECPDALAVHDLERCVLELRSHGLSGIAVLIDEADCLGRNVPLLQLFRNIFQVADRCSLLLAGTEDVFPALSQVFSPIPRQFHRIDVNPFAHWTNTLELVYHPILKEAYRTVLPEMRAVRELHELCGGAPDEVQLYCHHMYRSVENGSTKQMSLAPIVFREVFREYRSNSSENVGAVLNAIERLPDKLLCESAWVSRKGLSLEENIRVSILCRELEQGGSLTGDERSAVAAEMALGYARLFESGVIESRDRIRLAGAPLSAGYWKSFVEVERGRRWTWNEGSYADNLWRPILKAIGRTCGAVGQMDAVTGKGAVNALQLLREGTTPADFDKGMSEMILSAMIAQDNGVTHVADVTFQIESPAGKRTHQCRFFEKSSSHFCDSQFQAWVENHAALLANNEISIVVTAFARWELPSPFELHRLGFISGYPIPDVFGPALLEQAFCKFAEGDIPGCISMFKVLLGDRDAGYVRNNLAFCQLLTGDVVAGLDSATKATAAEYRPLFELNRGIGEFLAGDHRAARTSLRNALRQLRAPGSKADSDATYVLVLDATGRTCSYCKGWPVDAAILVNLWRMGEFDRGELESEMTVLYPETASVWLATLA